MKKDIFNKYSEAVAKQFHLTLDEMFSKTKRQDIVEARQILYYLCKERPIRFSFIQRFLEENGYKVGHSSIMHGYNQAKKMIEEDVDYKNFIDKATQDADTD
jgi:chromosomal replication initiation ATPase DnaA|tara:strand:- start:8439 stop:8744 length:306 start_codon:yes stop_codon:yes gene_type:complete